MKALPRSRMVHLATHGRHNVSAPAFQCLYMTPGHNVDGVVYAYELLGVDLNGVDVVTLSACETTLGRFDASDNLCGLPACLLLAGVSSIIGTLWDVKANAAQRFFSVLYEQLKAGTSKLDSFATAQRQTRKSFPEYRDWGAFCLIGKWE